MWVLSRHPCDLKLIFSLLRCLSSFPGIEELWCSMVNILPIMLD